ncbi:MAG: DUF1559 domain-containing protein [Pirellulales bacterium]
MREQLLGYLLGALEPTEREVLEDRLGQDDQLRGELALMRTGLEPLAEAVGRHDLPAPPSYLPSPPGLAARTCNFVAARSLVPSGGLAAAGGWRLQDWLVAAGIGLAAAMLLFPGISNSRFNARLAGCQNNLRQLGFALLNYSELHGGFFPAVPERGPLAVAGVYAATLKDAGLLETDSLVICPSSELARPSEAASPGDFRVPSVDDLLNASEEQWVSLVSTAGGSFGYGLGYIDEDGRYHGHGKHSRGNFPLMADAPHEETGGPSANHGSCGQNILFVDGHVEFLRSCRLSLRDDHIYQNAMGYVGAGIGPDDAVIARSPERPRVFPNLLDADE